MCPFLWTPFFMDETEVAFRIAVIASDHGAFVPCCFLENGTVVPLDFHWQSACFNYIVALWANGGWKLRWNHDVAQKLREEHPWRDRFRIHFVDGCALSWGCALLRLRFASGLHRIRSCRNGVPFRCVLLVQVSAAPQVALNLGAVI